MVLMVLRMTKMISWDLTWVSKQSSASSICDLIAIFFSIAEQNDSQHMIQNIKKICTDSSSDETTPRRNNQGIIYRASDILDPMFKIPFKYGWKRELVS